MVRSVAASVDTGLNDVDRPSDAATSAVRARTPRPRGESIPSLHDSTQRFPGQRCGGPERRLTEAIDVLCRHESVAAREYADAASGVRPITDQPRPRPSPEMRVPGIVSVRTERDQRV